MGRARQTFERRQLGLTLRRLREQAGKSQQAAADAIGKVRSRIVQVEEGVGTATAEDLVTLMDCYGVVGQERRTVLELGVQARKRQKRRAHTDVLPGSFERFTDLEASAAEIDAYEPSIIPGLLQSPGYLRAIVEDGHGVWWDSSDAELEERIASRLERQAKVLDVTAAKTLRFVLTEEALRGAVGSPEVMREQREHILKLLESKLDLTVRVLRSGTYGTPARGGGLSVFGFDGKVAGVGFSSVAFGPSTYFDEEADTTTLRRVFQRLRELALSPQESVRLIREMDKES